MKRVTTTVGYGGSFVRGNTIFLNPLTPSGTLDYNYQTPYGRLRSTSIEGSATRCLGIITDSTRRETRARSDWRHTVTGFQRQHGYFFIPVRVSERRA